ncbi:uncharacterized protein CTHT_0000480 [Thermochaetoides thermophila DSM 1495]|uniref:Uncharacterized protein n=1 Tax=Chaetomium thermophilum (strain DSM 1495 / CBS 144.50 / IMI 039719) TaxID=759272 RepID=G0RXV0_CHATD|nr:hypothetical protein CTHT_0000480 [Thermochaetoides thermophila DSM 1495]EGS24116.1 hypothetical protein CTHT_0000480 [Thermochaetoides thermophila DSM 1495]
MPPLGISTQIEGVCLSPSKSIKWLGVSLDPKLRPATHAAARASATALVTHDGLVVSRQDRERDAESDIPGVENDTDPDTVALVVGWLARPPYRGWSRLHQAAFGLEARPQWEPKRLGVRAWLGLPPPRSSQETLSSSP